MKRLLALLLALLPLAAAAAPTPPGDALPQAPLPLKAAWLDPVTGFAIQPPLLDFWEQHGRLAVFGRPISPFARTQWVERGRIELHPANAAPYTVQLGLVGRELLERQGRRWPDEDRGEPQDGPCELFSPTQRLVCGPFLGYWHAHGLDFGQPGVSADESLALFGLPLTAPQFETNSSGDRVLTQWFERARFEWHPANPPDYQVLLGRLGAELHGEPPAPGQLGVAMSAQVAQGHVFSLSVKTPTPLVSMVGMASDWPLAFVASSPTAWHALGGSHAMAAVGPMQVRVAGLDAAGRPWIGTTQTQLVSGNYASERVVLPPDVNDAIGGNPEQAAAERAAVNAVWPQVSGPIQWDGQFIMPAQGRIVSVFGTRRAYNDGPFDSYHEGLDIANAQGTPVVASAAGTVAFARPDQLVRGGAVIIDHGAGIHTGYWHMDTVLVREGQLVAQGDQIGTIGTKGFSTAPHVHWDVRIGSLNVDPQDWLRTDWSTTLDQ